MAQQFQRRGGLIGAGACESKNGLEDVARIRRLSATLDRRFIGRRSETSVMKSFVRRCFAEIVAWAVLCISHSGVCSMLPVDGSQFATLVVFCCATFQG